MLIFSGFICEKVDISLKNISSLYVIEILVK